MTFRPSLRAHRAFFVGAALLLGSARAQTRLDITQENALLSAAKAAIDSDREVFLAIQSIETKALAAASAAASRDGDRLILHTRSGEVKLYQDRPECKTQSQQNECQEYRLVAYARSRQVFVVAMLYYESLRFLLVDDVSGNQTTVRGFPNFSPTGEHVVLLLMNDSQLGFAVQVWRRAGQRFILDWSGTPQTKDVAYTTYELVRWNTENLIELRAETQLLSNPLVTKHLRFDLRHSRNGWEVVTRPE